MGPKKARRLYEAAGVDDLRDLERGLPRGPHPRGPGHGGEDRGQAAARPGELHAADGAERPPEGRPPAAGRGASPRPDPCSRRCASCPRSSPPTTPEASAVAGRPCATSTWWPARRSPTRSWTPSRHLPEVAQVDQRGDTKLAAVTHTGLGVDLRIVPPESYGNLLQHFTGSADHNVALRGYAQRRGYKISEYHVEHLAPDGQITCATEAEVYATRGPGLHPARVAGGPGRDRGGRAGVAPRPDRAAATCAATCTCTPTGPTAAPTLEEMAAAARGRGLEYLCFCDHSQSLAMTGGLTPERVLARSRPSAHSTPPGGISLLAGIEVDILADGRLDLPDDVLARLDFVTASIHSGFRQPRDEDHGAAHRRLRNPHVRLHRPPHRPAHRPARPATRSTWRRWPQWRPRPAPSSRSTVRPTASISTPAQRAPAATLGATPGHLQRRAPSAGFANLAAAVNEARRGWVSAADVANTRPLEDLLPR